MRKDYYFDSVLTPSLEAELQQMQKSIQITEIRTVLAKPEKLPWFKGWAEVLTVVALMGIAGLMLTGLIGGGHVLLSEVLPCCRLASTSVRFADGRRGAVLGGWRFQIVAGHYELFGCGGHQYWIVCRRIMQEQFTDLMKQAYEDAA